MRTEEALRLIGVQLSALPDAPEGEGGGEIDNRMADGQVCASCGEKAEVVYIVEGFSMRKWLDLCQAHAVSVRSLADRSTLYEEF